MAQYVEPLALYLLNDHGHFRFGDVALEVLGNLALELLWSDSSCLNLAHQRKRNFPIRTHRDGSRNLGFFPDIDRKHIIGANNIARIVGLARCWNYGNIARRSSRGDFSNIGLS